MAQIPTVTIDDPFKPGDFRIINESDFNPKEHTIFGESRKAMRVQGSASELGTDSGDQFSDEQLRASIETATGKAPHWKASRETLIARYNELNAAD